MTDPAEVTWAKERRTVPWGVGVGPGTCWLRIVPTKITGWRIASPTRPHSVSEPPQP